MRLFDFFKSDNSGNLSIDLTDYKFLSDDHTRIENGRSTNVNNKGAWRGIRIKTTDNKTFLVTIYNINENHPVWGNNIQMAEKRMKIVNENSEKIVLRGFGTDSMGASFADYGITLYKSNGNVSKITLHMHDRNIDIVYEKATTKNQTENLNKHSDFDDFISFTHLWNTTMPRAEKYQIAFQSDSVNNSGVEFYRNGDIYEAINYFEQALEIMPNNDDALKNLKMCYTKTGNILKVNEMEKKLNYLS